MKIDSFSILVRLVLKSYYNRLLTLESDSGEVNVNSCTTKRGVNCIYTLLVGFIRRTENSAKNNSATSSFSGFWIFFYLFNICNLPVFMRNN